MIVKIDKPVMSNVTTTEWQKMVKMLNFQMRGYSQITLLNDWNDEEPSVVYGSIWDTLGSYYRAENYEGITGWDDISIGATCWICYNWETNTFEYSSLIPSWDSKRQGWYRESNRYFFSLYKGSDTLYQNKQLLLEVDTNTIVATDYLKTTDDLNITNNLTDKTLIVSDTTTATNVTVSDWYGNSAANITTLNTVNLESWAGSKNINIKGQMNHDGIAWFPENIVWTSKSFISNERWTPPKGWYLIQSNFQHEIISRYQSLHHRHFSMLTHVNSEDKYVQGFPDTFYTNGSDVIIEFYDNLDDGVYGELFYYKFA